MAWPRARELAGPLVRLLPLAQDHHDALCEAMNTNAQRLLPAHAFEALDGSAVEFRTHRLNTVGRRAIERLGAQLDGALRHSTLYGITAAEWPAIRTHLDGQLAHPR